MAPKKDNVPPPSSKPAKSGGGKQKKKFDESTYDKLLTEAPKFKLITPSIFSDRMRINGSLARRAIRERMSKGIIRMVASHSSQEIYTRSTNT
ncbi:unnamed protein product [Cochlearia groenlandica]